MGHDAKRRGSSVANQRKVRRNRPGSEQAQLDTPIPPACPESHSSRSSSSLEHSAEETMSSVVCGERDTFTHMHGRMRRGRGQQSESSTVLPTAIPVKDICTHRPLRLSFGFHISLGVNHISQCLSFFTLCAFLLRR